jgi:hypothetical protein
MLFTIGKNARKALVMLATAVLAASCGPGMPWAVAPTATASPTATKVLPTKTEVPPTATASPTPEPSKTPEPTLDHVSIPGIDTYVESGRVSMKFSHASFSNEDRDYNGNLLYTTLAGYGQTFLIIDGVYTGDMNALLEGINQGGVYRYGKNGEDSHFYMETKRQPINAFEGVHTDGARFKLLFIVGVRDKGPYTIIDDVYNWKVVLPESLFKSP